MLRAGRDIAGRRHEHMSSFESLGASTGVGWVDEFRAELLAAAESTRGGCSSSRYLATRRKH
jgi:hypothetical protein